MCHVCCRYAAVRLRRNVRSLSCCQRSRMAATSSWQWLHKSCITTMRQTLSRTSCIKVFVDWMPTNIKHRRTWYVTLNFTCVHYWYLKECNRHVCLLHNGWFIGYLVNRHSYDMGQRCLVSHTISKLFAMFTSMLSFSDGRKWCLSPIIIFAGMSLYTEDGKCRASWLAFYHFLGEQMNLTVHV